MSGGTYGPVEVFRAGTFQPMAGAVGSFTIGDLETIASNYDPVSYPAPVVIGHPDIDAPAYGWVDKLYVEGEKLLATFKEVAVEFADFVKQGRYKKVSISLFTPRSNNGPKPGEFYLKHVGFLGAAAPAVSGLKPVKFAAGNAEALSFSQDVANALSFAESDELRRLRVVVASQKVDQLVNAGKVLPVFRDEVLSFAGSLNDSETVSFAEGQSSTRRDWFLSYLERQPKVVSFGAFNMGTDPVEGEATPLVIPEHYTVDPVMNQLYLRARTVEREKGVSFADALDIARGR